MAHRKKQKLDTRANERTGTAVTQTNTPETPKPVISSEETYKFLARIFQCLVYTGYIVIEATVYHWAVSCQLLPASTYGTLMLIALGMPFGLSWKAIRKKLKRML